MKGFVGFSLGAWVFVVGWLAIMAIDAYWGAPTWAVLLVLFLVVLPAIMLAQYYWRNEWDE